MKSATATAPAVANAPPTDKIERGAPAPKFDSINMLAPDRFAKNSFGWQTWQATIPENTPHEYLLAGGYWRKCAFQLRRGDHIQFRTDALTHFGELVVTAFDKATLNMEVRLLWEKEVDGARLAETEKLGYHAKDLGVHEGWAIFRDYDNHPMAKNLASFDAAMHRIRTEFVPKLDQDAARSMHKNM